MAKTRRSRTWAEVGVANGGLRATTRALKFTMAWGLATAELHRDPESIEEFAEVMEVSRATAFRDQQAFRKCYPTLTSPTEMNEATGQQERYNEFRRSLGSAKKAAGEAEATIFNLGAGPALSS